jgi:uncharacterized protein (DUF983 family)
MTQPSIALGLWRGFSGHCPNCGKGPILHRYLKVTSPCPVCGHDNAQYPSDDAPPYFTILIVGHLIVAPALCFSFIWTWPVGIVLAITLPAILAATLLLLPRVKGAVIGAQWAIHRNEGVVAGIDDPAAPVQQL